MRRYVLCRALSTHAWDLIGAIVVLKDNARRLTFVCARCGSVRQDKWRPNGVQLTRSYRHDKLYRSLLNEHDREGARALVVSEGKSRSEGNHPSLRLVQGKRASRGKSKRKRSKDRRWVA